MKVNNNVSTIDAFNHNDHEISDSNSDMSIPLSSSPDKEDMKIVELIHNIPDKATPFANKNMIASILKLVSVAKSSRDRKIFSYFKEFSHKLATKFQSPNVTDVCSMENTSTIL